MVGCDRATVADCARFLQIAIESANKLEYHLLLACDLGFLEISQHQVAESEVTQIKRMLVSLIQKLKVSS